MPTERKVAIVEDIAARMRDAAAVYFADYQGLSAPEATELRARLRDGEVQLLVVKKTLSRLAARDAGVGDIDGFLEGQTALAFTHGDPAVPARIIKDFGLENRGVPAITGLILAGQTLPVSDALKLASLPPKEILLGQLAAAIQQPLARLAATLNGSMGKLVMTLTGLKDNKTS